jgi:hypothetical protein
LISVHGDKTQSHAGSSSSRREGLIGTGRVAQVVDLKGSLARLGRADSRLERGASTSNLGLMSHDRPRCLRNAAARWPRNSRPYRVNSTWIRAIADSRLEPPVSRSGPGTDPAREMTGLLRRSATGCQQGVVHRDRIALRSAAMEGGLRTDVGGFECRTPSIEVGLVAPQDAYVTSSPFKSSSLR